MDLFGGDLGKRLAERAKERTEEAFLNLLAGSVASTAPAPPPPDPRGRRRGMRLAAQAHPRRRIRRGVGHRNDGRVGRHDPTTPRLPRRLIIVHPGIE